MRFRWATLAAATLIKRGSVVYSPITMTHPLDLVLSGRSETLGSDYWVRFDEAFMEKCAQMVVLQIDGWDRSSGVRREIERFKEMRKPISFMSEGDIDPSLLELEVDI
jgi:hypothetical protein